MTRPVDRDSPAAPVPVPRFATAWAALIYALATLILAWPAVAGKFLINPNSDQYLAGYAFREFAANWIRAGHGVPLWNPYLFGGMPYVAAMHGDIFYPTALLRLALPTDVAMTWGLIVHVFLAGLFTFVFLRAAGLGFFGALIGGLAYMLGGNVAGLVSPGHDGKLFVSALLPLSLFLLLRGVRDGRAWAWGALALTITLAVLSPHPQLLQYLLLTSGAYALFLAFSRVEPGGRLPRRLAFRRLGLAAVAVAVGLLGGAIQYLPLVEYTPWSPRAGGTDWAHATSYSMPPEELFNFYLPQFSGILGQYWGRNGIHLHSEYIGASALVLAGLASGTKGARSRQFLWFWTGVLIVAVLWALGGHTPFYRIVYALVPGTKFFRAPSTMLYVVSFSIAVLAGLGVDRALTRGGVSPRYLVAWVAAGLVVAALATSGALTNVATTLAIPQLADRVEQGAGALTVGAWRSLVAVVATVAVLLAIGRGLVSARAAGFALTAIIAFDLWSVERLYWRFSAPGVVLFKSDPAVDYLKRLDQPARVVALALAPFAGHIRDPYISGPGDSRSTGFMIHRVRNVVGYHGNQLGRYQELTGFELGPWPERVANPNLRRLTNLRYLYANAPQAPLPGMKLVVGPVTNVAGNIVYLFEFDEDNPAAWIAPIAIKAPDENVLATVLDPRFDVRRAALFDTAAPVPVQPTPPATLPPISDVKVRATRYEPGHISLALDRPAPAGSTLIVSENYYPGWAATVDGRPAPTGRVQYVLTGVGLPAGARSVELTFRSETYERGKSITFAALALSALMLAAGVLVSGRRSG
ncbi:MAG: YfhO family protein [Gemmatimonadaceae bacterium]